MTETIVLDLVLVVCSIPAYYRWLRVTQREHYLSGRVTSICLLWMRVRPINLLLWFVAATAVIISLIERDFIVMGALLMVVWPAGMPLRPTTKKLVFTPRLVRATTVLSVVLLAVIALLGPVGGGVALLAGPLLMDLVLLLLQPMEAALGRRFVRSAEAKLKNIKPMVIAITGSYGKTSTKQYVAHLIGGFRSTLASPASFNNLMGLSRTINERMSPGTEVFVAEMGTYGKGEIASLCRHFPPSISAITTIGEAHLERMRTRSDIVAAKAEITDEASCIVLNVDVPELAALADRLARTKRVVRCSTMRAVPADVRVSQDGPEQTIASVDGKELAPFAIAAAAHEVNVAIAIGIAYAAGVPLRQIEAALTHLPDVSHRALVQRQPTGVVLIDDTYNSNPTGAERAVRAAASLTTAPDGRVWVVTPGMIELGPVQRQRNRQLAQMVASVRGARLAVVGRTNRSALAEGARAASVDPVFFDTRASASRAVLGHAKSGDVVLFENDLPDHYP